MKRLHENITKHKYMV